MPFPVAPTVPGFEGPRPLPPSFGPQQPTPPSTPLPQIPMPVPASPPTNAPVVPQNAAGGLPVPIYTGTNTAPWASPTGQGYFGSGGGRLPSLAGMFNSMREGISNNRFARGLLGSLAGGMVAGPVGSIVGGLYGPQFLGGDRLPSSWMPGAAYDQMMGYAQDAYAGDMRNTSPEDLAALQEQFDAQRRPAFGATRGNAGFVTGTIDPGSLGIFEGSRMDESRAPQTAAQNQMR